MAPYYYVCYIDGACRGNGYYGAVGGAGLYIPQFKRHEYRSIDSHESPTNQRAELTALIMALEAAIERRGELYTNPWFNLIIKTDSKYVIGCLTDWLEKWEENGWLNSRGYPVSNQDLIKRAAKLQGNIEEVGGEVIFEYISREANQEADRLANFGCDEAD